MRQYIKMGIPYIIVGIMLLIGSFYDYPITNALYGKLPMISDIFERLLLAPIITVPIITFLSLYILYKKWYFIGISSIISFYVVWDTLHYKNDTITLYFVVITIVLAILYMGFLLFLLSRIDCGVIEKWMPHLMFFTLVLFTSILIVTILKMGWGRIRYRQLVGTNGFTAWYEPQGFNGFHSFPSGHTAVFSTILCFLETDSVKYGEKSVWLKILIWMGIIFMPLTRMMCGAHFLSDTAVGFMITYTCYLKYRNWFRKRGIL